MHTFLVHRSISSASLAVHILVSEGSQGPLPDISEVV